MRPIPLSFTWSHEYFVKAILLIFWHVLPLWPQTFAVFQHSDRPRPARTLHNGTTTVLQVLVLTDVDSRQHHKILRYCLTSGEVPCHYSSKQNVTLPFCLIRQKLWHQQVLRNGGRAPRILNLVIRWGERSVSRAWIPQYHSVRGPIGCHNRTQTV